MTIKDISAQTGYSVGTVSRVLNNQPNVSEKARKAILAVTSASGFQLNANAKQLKQQRATSILVVAKGTSNELFGSLIEALQARAGEYPLIVDYMDEDLDEVQHSVQLCREKKPLGILYLGGNPESFRNAFGVIDVPSVLITGDASALQFSNLSSVTTDDRLAGFLAVEHLAKLGHRHIGVIGGDREVSYITQRRHQGCVEAAEQYGLTFDPMLDYAFGRFSFADGYQAARQLIAKNRGITGIFAMADVMAIGAIRALRDENLRVPEDVAVVGMDGLNIGNYTIPKLTTVHQSVEALADKSMKLLLEQVEGKKAACHETIPPTLNVRESTVR